MCNALKLLAIVPVLILIGCESPPPTLLPLHTAPQPSATLTSATALPQTTDQSGTPSATPRPSPAVTLTVTATPSSLPATVTPAAPTVTLSADGRYAFPVAGDLALMTWTHFHWDGGNAVDIEAARHLTADSEAFNTFVRLPAVAVVSGTIAIADNHYGGLALLLYGEDGFTYYYGHLSEQWVEDSQIVGPGDGLGRIGNTGHNTQYIEPHLHFSIATHSADDWRWEPDINAAEQLLTWFELPWLDLDIADYPIDEVAGWPLAVPAEITRGFHEPLVQNPDQGSIDILPIGGGEDPIPVYATLGGEVNVNRATVMGLRVQITNRAAITTVVYSFLRETTVADGDVVQRGDLVGYIDPGNGLNYMLFVNHVPTDPVPTLGDPPWTTEP